MPSEKIVELCPMVAISWMVNRRYIIDTRVNRAVMRPQQKSVGYTTSEKQIAATGQETKAAPYWIPVRPIRNTKTPAMANSAGNVAVLFLKSSTL